MTALREAKLGRVVVAGLFAAVMGAQAVRSAIVEAKAENAPEVAGAVWPNHPDVLRSSAMAGVGSAAARRSDVPDWALNQLNALAARAPLAPDPYLVAGARALRAGEIEDAERLLLHARERAPRTVAVRYLLADLYLRDERVLAALKEMAVLARLAPGIRSSLGQSIAAYAQTPGAVAKLRALLRTSPELEPVILSELAADAANAQLILSIAWPRRGGDAPPAWQNKLVASLIEAGQYRRAYALWQSGSRQGAHGRALDFARAAHPSPFSWSYESGPAGVAEPEDGGLRVLFFGNRDVTLARRLALLPAGAYELTVEVAGNTAGASGLTWVVTCLPGGARILEAPLSRAESGKLAAAFEVPEGCEAQRLELKGYNQVIPSTVEVRLSRFDIKPARGS